MDVIALAKNGWVNSVATLGTALTEEQAKILKRYFKEAVICYDSDGAGRTATNRAITIMRKAGLKASVMYLSGGKDPDEFIKKMGKEAFNSALNGRKTDITYLLEYFREKYDINIDGQKVAYTEEIVPYLLLIENPVELDVYVNKLSEITGISSQSLYSQLGIKKVTASVGKPAVSAITESKIKGGRSKADSTREALLALIIASPTVYKANKPFVSEELFGNGSLLEIFKYVKNAYEQNGRADVNLMMSSLGDDCVKELSRILSIDSHVTDENKALRDYAKILREELRREKIYETLNKGNVEELNHMLKNN